MNVFVVMSNDYPDCVFQDEAKAEAYANEKNAAQKIGRTYSPRIYYRVYEFEVR